MTTSLHARGSARERELGVGGDPTGTPNAGYLTIARFFGDGDRVLDEYRRHSDAMSEVGADHGLIAHVGAKTADGFLIVNLWPSKDGSEAAARDPRRRDVVERTGIDPAQISREHHDVAHFVVFE